MILCPTCGKENEDFFKFCLGCGTELKSVAPPKPEPVEREPLPEWPLHNTSPEMEALSDSTIAEALRKQEPEPEVESSAKVEFRSYQGEPSDVEQTPEAPEAADSLEDDSPAESQDGRKAAVLLGGIPDPDDIVTVVRPAISEAETARQCRVCAAGIPLDFTFCVVCGAPAVIDRDSASRDVSEFGLESTGESRGQLVLLREDGVDRASYDLDSGMTLVGREGCQINFVGDEFLAPQHAKLFDLECVTVREVEIPR